MTNRFALKLALSNISKNRKFYIPFMLAGAGTIMMFYITFFLEDNSGISSMRGSDQIRLLMALGVTVIGIFAVIFLLYTNSFIIKRRLKEFGLYNILGMEKKHIGRILFIENIIIAVLTIIGGTIFGIVFSKLIFMVLTKVINMPISLVYAVSTKGILVTLAVFSLIYLVAAVWNQIAVRKDNPVNLLSESNAGEKEPKTKGLMAVIGFICLGIGYAMALNVNNPIDALMFFFVAVVLVILGTYFVFIAGSIAILKALKKNKLFYYNSKHFVPISGMIYRMKQNAVGLANICILSTMVLVMISTTVCMYLGINDAINVQLGGKNTDLVLRFGIYADEETIEEVRSLDNELVRQIAVDEAKKLGADVKVSGASTQYALVAERNDDEFTPGILGSAHEDNLAYLLVMTEEDYNKNYKENLKLEKDEIGIAASGKYKPGKKIFIGEKAFGVKKEITSKLDIPLQAGMSDMFDSFITVIVSNSDVLDNIVVNQRLALKEYSPGMTSDVVISMETGNMSLAKEDVFYENVKKRLDGEIMDKYSEIPGYMYMNTSRASMETSMKSLIGGLFFLGVFLGLVFTMAAVMIIYYKQISEGYYDRDRFQILQKVGMSDKEIKRSIKSQVLMVFFLPLVMAAVHVAFAFPMITKLMGVLSLSNTKLFLLCTLVTFAVFSLIYAVVYSLTAKEYYKIVKK